MTGYRKEPKKKRKRIDHKKIGIDDEVNNIIKIDKKKCKNNDQNLWCFKINSIKITKNLTLKGIYGIINTNFNGILLPKSLLKKFLKVFKAS